MKINVPEFEARVKTGAIRKYEPTEPNGMTGWCYTERCQYEKMWDIHTVLARGIVTLSDGTVIARPFPKFFNLGEKEAEPINWKESIEVTEKVDGSLIIVAFFRGKAIINSKGSFNSEHAMFARDWLNTNASEWLAKCIREKDQNTYLFEAVFPSKNPNEVKVINYGDKKDLTLLAVINTYTGKEYSYAQLKELADTQGFPLVPRCDFEDINSIISACKARPSINDGEGLVLHFVESGKRIKVKSDVYIRLHRLISHANKKTILLMLMNGDNIEEVYSPLPDELYEDVKKWVSEFTTEYNTIKSRVEQGVELLKTKASRSEQAKCIYTNPELAELKGLLFAALDGNNVTQSIWQMMKKKLKEAKKDD